MKIRVLSAFQRRLETVVEYAAFHDQFTSIDGQYSTVNFWQAEDKPMKIFENPTLEMVAFEVEEIMTLSEDGTNTQTTSVTAGDGIEEGNDSI